MNYINESTLQYPISEQEIRLMFPDTMFQNPFQAPEGFAEVAYTAPPEIGPAQVVHEGLPKKYDGRWQQAWDVFEMTREQQLELLKSKTPESVARWQAKLALMSHHDDEMVSYWDRLVAYVETIQQPALRLRMEAALYEVLTWRRDSPMVAEMSQILRLQDHKIDELFLWAGNQEL